MTAVYEQWLEAGHKVHAWWQIAGYVVLTAAEGDLLRHRSGIQLHAGPAQDEVADYGAAAAVDFAGELHHRRDQQRDQASATRWTEAVPGSAYYWTFTVAMQVTAVL